MEVKRGWVLLVIAANLLVLLALAFLYPHLMVAPGALIPAHAELTTDCFACHAPLRGASPQRCMVCHAAADIGVRTSKGAQVVRKVVRAPFHQDLIAKDCMACHSDHQGPKLTRVSRKAFSHDLLRADKLDQCERCHVAPKTNLHSRIEGKCGQCHSSQHWTPATFDHTPYFELDRDHDVKCVTCHVGHDYTRYTCYGCHEHTPEKVRADHEEEGISRNLDRCAECHSGPDGEPGEH